MNTRKDIAVIGVSGLFPGADALDDLYDVLRTGKDQVGPIPAARRNYSCPEVGARYKNAGALHRVDCFDYPFFNIPKAEAKLIDPQQRLLLQLAGDCIMGAGYRLSSIAGTRTGVFLSASPSSYVGFTDPSDPLAVLGNCPAVIAGRISYHLNLRGPSMMIDTGCSSSLVAVIEACRHLQTGACTYALAGGIRINGCFTPVATDQGGDPLASASAKCRTFDDAADGIVSGEGGGVVLLKLLDRAIEDGDNIHGIIKGFAVNHNGSRTMGIAAPSPDAQTELVEMAWENAGIEAGTISYIEAHGTGTRLGDPIEFRALTDAFKRHTAGSKFCGIGSIKTNIGHLDTAAGIAGLIKVLLSMRHRQLFPSLHFNKPNELIDFEDTALFVVDRLHPWPSPDGPRRAGVSAFGFSGSNAHIVVEEYAEPRPDSAGPEKPVLLTISAKTPAAFRQYLKKMRVYIDRNTLPLERIAYTMNTGTEDYSLRAALTVVSIDDLRKQLDGWIKQVEEGREMVRAIDRKELVVLFSGMEQVDLRLIGQLHETQPVFKHSWDSCMAQYRRGEANTSLSIFAFQYAAFQLLKDLGFSSKYHIGTGVGNLVIAAIANELSVAEAVEKARAFQATPTTPDRNALANFLKKISGPLFLEMGCGGILTQLLQNEPGVKVLPIFHGSAGFSAIPFTAELYRQGVPPDWKAWYGDKVIRKVQIPGYPFEEHSAWAAPLVDWQEAGSKRPSQEGLYILNWLAAGLPAETGRSSARQETWLVVTDGSEWQNAFFRQWKAIHDTGIVINPGTSYRRVSDSSFVLDFSSRADFQKCLLAIGEKGTIVDGVLYFGAIGYPSPGKELDERLRSLIYSPLLLAGTLSEITGRAMLPWIMITANAFRVETKDSRVDPPATMAVTIMKGVGAKYPFLKVRFVDIDVKETDPDRLVDLIRRERLHPGDEDQTAYRGGVRYLPQKDLAAAIERKNKIRFADEGIYLITGGAKGIGLEISKSIADKYRNCRLILFGRTPRSALGAFPAGPEAMIARGRPVTVDYYTVDIADEAQMKKAFEEIRRKYTRIDGVIHCAGEGGSFRPMENKPMTAILSTLHPKIHGTLLLYELCRQLDVGFWIGFSSLNSLLPDKNNLEYAAANAFLDGFFADQYCQGNNFISLRWTAWEETGMYFQNIASRHPELRPQTGTLTNEEGIRLFYEAIQCEGPDVLVLKNSHKTAPSPVAATEKEDLTQVITAIWKETLGVDKISAYDNFFDLGGHSLLGFALSEKVLERTGLSFDPDEIYSCPTITEIVSFLEEKTVALSKS
jgi:3-oxoacyl-(acyl-carrier-protein) synthase/acyl carrier protein